MAKPKQFTIHLMRVGESSWDADKRVNGVTDLPMTDQSQQAVISAIQSFKPKSAPTLLLTSEEESSLWIANLIKSSTDLKIKSIETLSNVGMGLWEGELESSLEERCPSAFNQWKEHPARITPPEGESFVDAKDRLIASLTKQLSKCKGDHPQVILILRSWSWAILRCWLTDTKMCDLWDQLQRPIQIETFELTKEQLDSYQPQSKASV